MIIVALFVGAAIVLTAVDFNLPWIQGRTYNLLFQEKIFTIDNALDGAELYLETSSLYSVYQACHDSLKNPSVDPLEFRSAVSTRIQTHMNKYSESQFIFFDEHAINLPQYTVEYDDATKTFILNAEKIVYEIDDSKVNETIHLERNSILMVPFICETIHTKYVEVKQKMEQDISPLITQEIESGWPKEATKDPLITTDCDAVFQSITGKTIIEASNEMSQNVKTNIQTTLPQSDATFEIKIDMPDVPTVIEGKFIQQDSTGTVCDFTYDINVTLTVEIKDKTQMYSVYENDVIQRINPVATISGTIKASGFVTNELVS